MATTPASTAAHPAPASSPAPTTTVVEPVPASGQHTVQKGETLYAVARKYGLRPRT
ncbi:LysM peptidoglycan-binding domain-containing protein [Hymenobacter cellulosilyticus]|uniref:LysM peptidoglycan-binding domain-containing protein n=1 Tax=Hymenobacter cellulosilyticus TaxID=2932248 RepID=A0A8T9Q5H0_9BACT|nr:LysM domain-containing protein [Hymenobacter cellulosilyticus]UOQ72212.1 LysM peptidoglycan-binding domain-containing protein [Hymenobacter cellulosilyticus]